MQDSKKLKVWEKGHQLTLGVYKITSSFPKAELYGLTARFVVRLPRFPPTLQKGAADLAVQSLPGSS